MAQSGIKAFSRGLAEALVLGKNLNMTMKEIAQSLISRYCSIYNSNCYSRWVLEMHLKKIKLKRRKNYK